MGLDPNEGGLDGVKLGMYGQKSRAETTKSVHMDMRPGWNPSVGHDHTTNASKTSFSTYH